MDEKKKRLVTRDNFSIADTLPEKQILDPFVHSEYKAVNTNLHIFRMEFQHCVYKFNIQRLHTIESLFYTLLWVNCDNFLQ